MATLCLPRAAEAFCGFYVSGSDQQLAADATQVVLMREEKPRSVKTRHGDPGNSRAPTRTLYTVVIDVRSEPSRKMRQP
ncbi:MAG TPA: hypothetical protein VNO30_30155 [Kofleriaceae bacterium]|nr:hypothetical protein [Kofleriaceae bacterium]